MHHLRFFSWVPLGKFYSVATGSWIRRTQSPDRKCLSPHASLLINLSHLTMFLLNSVGKTSFIKYLLGRDFPGIRVGPEPTTDRFTAILHGRDDKIIPGAALCAQNFRPFTGLSPFGNNFLSRMEGVELDSAILHNVTLIDTPGILSGLKQRNRNYDYEAVMKWFAERADLIVIMFDAHKLDISDEMKQVIELMIPHLDKVRIVLNKADTISTQVRLRMPRLAFD